MKAGYAEMARRVLPALWAASRQGELPIVCDAVVLHRRAAADAGERDRRCRHRYAALRIVDAVAFVARARAAPAGGDPEGLGAWRCTPPARPPGWG